MVVAVVIVVVVVAVVIVVVVVVAVVIVVVVVDWIIVLVVIWIRVAKPMWGTVITLKLQNCTKINKLLRKNWLEKGQKQVNQSSTKLFLIIWI